VVPVASHRSRDEFDGTGPATVGDPHVPQTPEASPALAAGRPARGRAVTAAVSMLVVRSGSGTLVRRFVSELIVTQQGAFRGPRSSSPPT